MGYYGGVNYGFGYGGIGLSAACGAVVSSRIHCGDARRFRRGLGRQPSLFSDRTIIQRNTIINNSRVSYNGGPGGIRHDASPDERNAMRDQHMGATSIQEQHVTAARNDRSFYAKNNAGRPQNLASARPLGYNERGNQGAVNNNRGAYNNQSRPEAQNRVAQPRPTNQVRPNKSAAPRQYSAAE